MLILACSVRNSLRSLRWWAPKLSLSGKRRGHRPTDRSYPEFFSFDPRTKGVSTPNRYALRHRILSRPRPPWGALSGRTLLTGCGAERTRERSADEWPLGLEFQRQTSRRTLSNPKGADRLTASGPGGAPGLWFRSLCRPAAMRSGSSRAPTPERPRPTANGATSVLRRTSRSRPEGVAATITPLFPETALAVRLDVAAPQQRVEALRQPANKLTGIVSPAVHWPASHRSAETEFRWSPVC
jgi:hypothetical protein